MHCQFSNRNRDTFRYIKKHCKIWRPESLFFLLCSLCLNCILGVSFIFLICSLYKNFILGVHPDHIYIGGQIFKEPTHAHLVCINIFAINKDKKGSKKGLLFGALVLKSKGFRIEGVETERETNFCI